MRNLPAFHPKLGSWKGAVFTSAIRFFNYRNQAHQISELGGGAGDLRYFFIQNRYKRDIHSFKHRPLKHPVIVLVDNDDGGKDLFKTISSNYGIVIDYESPIPFFHVTDNLYLIKTPELGASGISCIEDFFEPSLLKTELEGKQFNPDKDHDAGGEYGKTAFAEKVVHANATKINFSGFGPLFDRIAAVIDHYKPPAAI